MLRMVLPAIAPLLVLMANPAIAAPRKSAISDILAPYIQIQESLAADKDTGVKEAAKKIIELSSGNEKLSASARKLRAASDIKTMREEFKKLSEPIVAWAKKVKPAGHIVVYCSMAPGRWVQKEGAVANPYYGAEMLECGDIEK
jgi:hypothetical protein